MSDGIRFHWSHGVALLIGAAAMAAILLMGSPRAPDYSPALRRLEARNRALRDSVALSDSALAFWKLRDSSKTAAIAVLERREADALAGQRYYASTNRALLDSLRVRPTDTLLIAQLDSGIAHQDRACTDAVALCAMAKDSLRGQIKDRDSIITADSIRIRSVLAHADTAVTAVGTAENETGRVKRTLLFTRIGAVLLLVGVAIFK